MPVHQLPIRSVAAVHVGYPQRTVLVRQAADLAVLPLDHGNDNGVTPDVGLNVLQPRFAALEEVG